MDKVAYNREWRKKNPEKYAAQIKKDNKIQWERHSEKRKQKRMRDHRKIRIEMIKAYGSQCACCGETQPEFLCLDHKLNDGAQDRKDRGVKAGAAFYAQLKREGWPTERYQLLCYNCNNAKRYTGICPHQASLVL